jgi:hypothetical protein
VIEEFRVARRDHGDALVVAGVDMDAADAP